MTTRLLVACLALVLGTGCAGLTPGTTATEDYTVTVCATGLVERPCQTYTLPVPTGGQGVLALGVALALPYLYQQVDRDECEITATPEPAGRGVRVTARAACLVNGVPAEQVVTLTLVPAA